MVRFAHTWTWPQYYAQARSIYNQWSTRWFTQWYKYRLIWLTLCLPVCLRHWSLTNSEASDQPWLISSSIRPSLFMSSLRILCRKYYDRMMWGFYLKLFYVKRRSPLLLRSQRLGLASTAENALESHVTASNTPDTVEYCVSKSQWLLTITRQQQRTWRAESSTAYCDP